MKMIIAVILMLGTLSSITAETMRVQMPSWLFCLETDPKTKACTKYGSKAEWEKLNVKTGPTGSITIN